MKIYALLVTVTVCCCASIASAGEKVFVAESFANQIEAIDTADFSSPKKVIDSGLTPRDLKLTADGKSLYVANYLSSDLTEIDPLALTARRTIDLSCMPSSLAVSPDGKTGYAICRNIERLIYIDLPSGTETAALRIPFPYSIAVTPDGQRAYVSRSMFSRYVDVVDLALGKVTTSITVGRSPQGILVSPSGGSVYTANAGAASVSVLDTVSNTVRKTIAVGRNPVALAIDSEEKFLYVANRSDSTVSVINLETNQTVTTIPVGVSPQALALSAEQPYLYVANNNSNTMSVIDTQSHQVTATIPVGIGPEALVILAAMDNTPPEVELSVEDDILWPPNHKLMPVSVKIAVSDDQDPRPRVQLMSISSNEPCSDATVATSTLKQKGADPSNCSDIADAAIGTNDITFMLRAERFGYSDTGRIYTITYKVTDAAGNVTLAETTVQVPLNFSEK